MHFGRAVDALPIDRVVLAKTPNNFSILLVKIRPCEVNEKFVFRTNDYYQSLIDWSDPEDPIRRIVIPDVQELDDWGRLDASNEESYTVAKGIEHKYDSTALLLVNEVCAAYCRFCFRKRIFMDINDEVVRDVTEGLEYIRDHKELNNILITGGDPLVMSTRKLEKIIRKLREIDHVQIIRIGTKIPAFYPFRIINDPHLLEMLCRYSTPEKKIYMIVHFNHPRELTEEAIESLHMVHKTGVVVTNQTPIIRGINDSVEVLAELLDKLSFIGVPPYYVFQCRPTQGNKHLSVPVEKAYEIHEQARMRGSGLAKRSRIIMSHSSGKIEILCITEKHVIFKLHRAAQYNEKARIIIFKRNPEAYWFDDYKDKDIMFDYTLNNPFYDYRDDIETALSMG